MLAPLRLGLCLGLVLSAGSCGQGSSATLSWYYTCGDPTCHGYTPRLGVPLCTSAEANDQSCSTLDQECDPIDNCNRLLICAYQSPASQIDGGCPH